MSEICRRKATRGAPIRPRRSFVAAALILLIVGCHRTAQPPQAAPKVSAAVGAHEEALALPAPPSEGFVGSDACVKCHVEEARHYQGHPMSQSLADALQASSIEDYERSEFSPLESFSYYVEKTSNEIVHHEKRVDSTGEVIYDQGIPVAFTVGSGARGRTYLINDEGRLYASPISWYTRPQKWDLSPGYSPQFHQRFERRMSDGCLACHAGRVAVHGEDLDRFAKQPFLEKAIGCERCHGPGQEHIAHWSAPRSENSRDPIFNPAGVTDARRDAVCNQCHLQGRRRVVRYGRTEFDFRPGMFLSDNWIIFLKTAGTEKGTAAAVSQVEQMYASQCYQQSQGALSCISCHNGHSPPQAEQVDASYRKKCVSCHSQGKVECSEDLTRRRAVTAVDSCIVCHMPKFAASDVHAAQTDHRVLRRAPTAEAEPAQEPRSHDAKLVLFNEPGVDVSKAELDRARGIFLAEQAGSGGADSQARAAVDLLLPMLKRAPKDIEGRFALGRAFGQLRQPQLSAQVWEQVLALQPTHEDALESLATQYHESQNLTAARQYYERLIEVNPGRSHYFGRLAHVLGQLGELPAAVKAGERCLELNPSLVQTHAWLVEACRKTGDPERAAFHEKKLKQFQSVSKPPTNPNR